MTQKLIDGKLISAKLKRSIKEQVEAARRERGLAVCLAVVLVGDDAASAVYVRNKHKACEFVGIESRNIVLPGSTTQEDLEATVARLNDDKSVHGILLQLPLPKGLNADRVLQLINPEKDVDGLSYVNSGKTFLNIPDGNVACTPQGIVYLLHETLGPSLTGKTAVVIGRSRLVGLPVAALLIHENCTVTVAHSKTVDIESLCATADIVVAAIGRPNLVKRHWIKDGAVVIDVGINRVTDGSQESRLVGDVDFDDVIGKSAAITPVPGGVGPMTIACLLINTLNSAIRSAGT